jgi:hypothetical protein
VVNGIEGLEFAKSADYGFVTSCPTNLGTGMRASVHIPLPNLTKDGTDKQAKEIAKPLGLSVRGTGGEHTPIGKDGTCDISPSARFCITEAQIITALYNGLKLLKEEEEARAPDERIAAVMPEGVRLAIQHTPRHRCLTFTCASAFPKCFSVQCVLTSRLITCMLTTPPTPRMRL